MMNQAMTRIARLRSKRIVLPAVAAVAVIGVGGTAWATTASTGDELAGGERDRVAQAATQAVGGTATEVETSDDPGEAYEVEVRTEDGTEAEVALDADLAVVNRSPESDDDADDDDADDRSDRDDDADERALTAEERSAAKQAALAAVGGGTVTDVEASDDPGEAYEVEVHAEDGTEWDLTLDAGYEVLHQVEDKDEDNGKDNDD